MKLLGIDYGSKRVGTALSNDDRTMAFPLLVIKNDENLLKNVVEMIKDHKVEKVIIGESNDYKQNPNPIMKEIEEFMMELEKLSGIKAILHPELLSSLEAERIQGKNDMLDASAAAIILQSYIDLNKK